MVERYKSLSKETSGVLKGEYGATPAAVNIELQARVLEGAEPITCRPADLLSPEIERLTAELKDTAAEKGIQLAAGENEIDDVLTYALFPEIGLRFLQNRGDAEAFEPVPTAEQPAATPATSASATGAEVYTVSVAGQSYVVEVAEGGDVSNMTAVPAAAAPVAASNGAGEPVVAPLAGNIFKVNVAVGEHVQQGDVIIILEAMKMETEVRAAQSGEVVSVNVKEGDSVAVGDTLLSVS